MRLVILPNDANKDLLCDISEVDITHDWKPEADIVFYENSLERALAKWSETDNISNFVSLKNFKQDGKIEFNNFENYNLLLKEEFDIAPISEVRNKILAIVARLDLSSEFSDFHRYLETIIIELVQNALIKIKNEKLDEKATLNILQDTKSYCIQVTDRLGLLNKNDVLSKLKRAFETRSFENKKSGAGLGFFMLLDASDKLVFSISPNKKTTVSCIVNKYKRLKDYKNKNVSIHFIK